MKDDDYCFLRKKMVAEQIKRRGINNKEILRVFENVPRHIFVQTSDKEHAYGDYPLPIGDNQTISQPYIVAQMIDALDLKPDDTLLEVGTGSGYQTAILSPMVKKVVTIERIESLYKKAKATLKKLGCNNVEYYYCDGKKGIKECAPYDKIIVSAASKCIPQDLLEQLNIGGKMVIPIGGNSLQKLLLIKRRQNHYEEKILGYCRFVRLI